MALAAPFYRVWEKKQPVMKFLWLWFVVDLAFLTISAGKRQHYIVPLMPAMAILIGILIEDMAFVQKGFTAKKATNTLRSHIVVLIVLAITGPIALIIAGAVKETPLLEAKTNYQLFADAVFLGIIILILAAAVTLLFIKKRPAFGCATVFVGIVILTMISFVRIVIPLDVNRHSRDFSTKVGHLVPPDEKLIAYKWVSSRSVHYVGRVIPVVEDKSAIEKFYEHGGWVLATREYLEELQQVGELRTVYYKEKGELRSQKDVPGALLHKSAPEVANDSQM
jgi:4-amino-4-deoxy-L-arabinose transferase-like glycosyltransferase